MQDVTSYHDRGFQCISHVQLLITLIYTLILGNCNYCLFSNNHGRNHKLALRVLCTNNANVPEQVSANRDCYRSRRVSSKSSSQPLCMHVCMRMYIRGVFSSYRAHHNFQYQPPPWVPMLAPNGLDLQCN